MIDMIPGYDRIPRFQGFRDAPTAATPVATVLPPVTTPVPTPPGGALTPVPPALQTPVTALIENAVVYGGVPLCGYIFLTKRGPSAWLAAALGLGIGYLYWQNSPGY